MKFVLNVIDGTALVWPIDCAPQIRWFRTLKISLGEVGSGRTDAISFLLMSFRNAVTFGKHGLQPFQQ